jgi:hypothetical protein
VTLESATKTFVDWEASGNARSIQPSPQQAVQGRQTMRRIITTIVAAVLLAACSGEGVDTLTSQLDSATGDSVADQVEENAVELAANVEQQMDILGEDIESSGVSADLESAWTQIQTEVTTAIASMQTDGTISADGLREALDAFQTELEAAGNEITPEVRSAWNSLRSDIEQMMG